MKTIKTLIEEKRFEDAIQNLLDQITIDRDTNELLGLARWIDRIPTEAWQKRGFLNKRIAILGGYSSQFLAPLMRLFLLRRRILSTIFESEYGLYEQVIFSEASALIDFAPDACYFYVGSDQLQTAFPERDLASECARWLKLWDRTHQLLSCEIIQNTFEEPLHRILGNFEFRHPTSESNFIKSLNSELSSRAPRFVHFNDVNALAAHYGRRQWRDEKLYDLAKVPVAFEFLPAYAESATSVCANLFTSSRKCIVLDLDNTLWGGVIGDDGLAGIKIGEDSGPGEAFRRFQSYLLKLKQRGVLLAVCSKNDDANAREPFLSRKEMILKLTDISCFVANWKPKSDNIIEIANQLNIGLDSLVFIDDNPAERDLVRGQLPEVAVLEMPEDPSNYTLILSRTFYFDAISLTTEDLAKADQYSANALRRRCGAGGGQLQ